MRHFIATLLIGLLNISAAWAVVPCVVMPDANYVASQNDVVICTRLLTAPRIITLPSAASTSLGQGYPQTLTGLLFNLEVLDVTGVVSSSNTITISPQPGESINGTVNGAVVMNAPNQQVTLYPTTGSSWFAITSPPSTFVGPVTVGGPLTITASGLTKALITSQNASGTTLGTCVVGSGTEFPCLNLINIPSEDVSTGAFLALDYVQIHANIGGSLVTGARQMLDVTGDFTTPTSPSNTNRNYAAVVGQMNVLSGDGGTGITPSTALGAFFAGNFAVRNSAANLYSTTGIEVDMVNGAAVLERIGYSAVSFPGVQGGTRDEAYHVGSVAGSGAIGWLTALGLSDGNSGAPLDSTNGCVICTDGSVHTIKTFADLSSYTISGNILKFNNFQVSGAGELVATGEFIGPATGAGVIQISPTIAGNQSYIQFLDAGTSKFIVGKQTDNSFIMVDAANSSALFLSVSTGGNLTLGETGKATTISTTLSIAGIPTSAGSGGLYVCVDTSGNTYKKSSCP